MKGTKKLTTLLTASALALSLAACSGGGSAETPAPEGTTPAGSTAPEGETYLVGICQLAPHNALDAATQGFKDALTAEFGDAVKFSEGNAGGDSNNCITIIISCEMLKPLAKKFKIAPKRFASILDIFACIMLGLSPIGMNVLAIMAFGGLTNPFSMMKYAFYLYALGIIMLLTIHFDLMKTKEEIEGQEFYPELDAQ